MSVPHILSSGSGMIVPLWLRGPGGGRRGSAPSRPCLPHQAQHAAPSRCAGPAMTQPRPDLAVALAVKRAAGEHRPDRLDQRRVRHRPLRPRPAPRRRPAGAARRLAIDRRPRRAPDPADAGETVSGVPLEVETRSGSSPRPPPGQRAPITRLQRSIFASSNSRSSSISPRRAFSRALSSASPSVGRVARLASPAARKASRQPESVAAVTPSERDTSSRSSPRSRRSTASRLRCRDIRPPRPRPAAAASAVVSIVMLITPVRGYRPLAGCLNQPCGGGALSDCALMPANHAPPTRSPDFFSI